MQLFDRRIWALALMVALSLLLAQFAFRPPWRDEYWALYFSAPGEPILDAVSGKMVRDVHPPLYFSLLHYWRQIGESELFARSLNLVFLGLGGWLAWSMRRDRVRETALYLLLCATSFWLVFFSAEIRMMAGLFILCAILVLAGRNMLQEDGGRPVDALVFLLCGAAAASCHFFGALWTGSLGLMLGLAVLLRGEPARFVKMGLVTTLALLPVLAWIALVRPDQNPGAISAPRGFLSLLEEALEQFLRGVTVKTAFANLALTIAAICGLGAALRGAQGRETRPLLWAVGLAVAIAFGVHLFLVAMIKERAFIVIIPPILYLASVAVLSLRPEQSRAQVAARWIPLVAALSLPLFSSELFKDRERYGAVRAFLADHPACAGSPILTYERPSDQAQDFSWFFTRSVLAGAFSGEDPRLVRLAEAGEMDWAPACTIRALALSMPRGTRGSEEMYAALSAAGYPIEDWQEVVLGEGRSRVFIAD
ncbi:MAG: hypothetical protein MRY64_04150 [Hyphomonadaceae bacterium]|nr:hypothetical protein [Hyphomonadaceae bacterium]